MPYVFDVLYAIFKMIIDQYVYTYWLYNNKDIESRTRTLTITLNIVW